MLLKDACRPKGSLAAIFSDWRQVPLTTNYLQAAGLIWRGIVACANLGLPYTGIEINPHYFDLACERINQIDPTGYAEPFVGIGGVFLRRNKQPKTEVINNISGDIATLFRVLQRHYAYFIDFLKFQITNRREFERLVKTEPTTLTDLERAARFIYLQKTAFGGKVSGVNFGVDKYGPARFNVMKLEAILESVHERLAGVVIENLPW